MNTQEVWLTTQQAAKHLGKPRSWLDNNAASVGVPRVKIGAHYRYPQTRLDAWLLSQIDGAA